MRISLPSGRRTTATPLRVLRTTWPCGSRSILRSCLCVNTGLLLDMLSPRSPPSVQDPRMGWEGRTGPLSLAYVPTRSPLVAHPGALRRREPRSLRRKYPSALRGCSSAHSRCPNGSSVTPCLGGRWGRSIGSAGERRGHPGRRASEIHALWERFAENEPDGRYYHLEWWATRRDRRGEGLGTRLLREDLERVDADRLPAYLESTNPANIPRYEALGFRAMGEFAAPAGPTITTMWREAR